MKYLILTRSGYSASGVLSDWTEVLKFYDENIDPGIHSNYQIVEISSPRVMTEWVNINDNNATLIR